MTHYERLGISPTASLDDIKRAFRRMAMKTHPDRCRGGVEETRRAHDEFCALSNAYRELIDPLKRAAYDERTLDRSIARPVEPRPNRSMDLSFYYAELDAVREEIWNTPRNEFIRETLLHLGFLLLILPVYVVLLHHAYEQGLKGAGLWRALPGLVTVPLLGLWSLWQISVRVQRIRAAGGLRRFFRRPHERRRHPRGGEAVELGFLPIVLLAFGFADAVLLYVSDQFDSGLRRGLLLALVPSLLFVWLIWRNIRRRRREQRRAETDAS
jgi:curved DNA-binding protein CbpA